MGHSPIIEFEGVSFSYEGGDAPALRDVDLRIGEGEFVCIAGGNGSGKSTLARHVNALLSPTRGTVRVLGHDTSDRRSLYGIRSKVGMVFQSPDDQIVASLVGNDVAFGPRNLGLPADAVQERVACALERVGLSGMERREVATLSGGQKQRVAIAGALAMQPRILVLDEATAMLDAAGRQDVLAVVRDLHAEGMTVLCITHAAEEAVQANRIIVLDEGRLVLEGAPERVFAQENPSVLSAKLELPSAVRLSRALRERGLPVPLCLSEQELVSALAEAFRGA